MPTPEQGAYQSNGYPTQGIPLSNPYVSGPRNDIQIENLERVQASGGLAAPDEENFNTAAMQGSMQQILSEYLGHFVVCEFLVGTQAMTRKQGILYSVGRGYLTLYEESSKTFVVCDVFSVKFVTFYLPGNRPGQSGAFSDVPMVYIPGTGLVPAGAHGIGSQGASAGPFGG